MPRSVRYGGVTGEVRGRLFAAAGYRCVVCCRKGRLVMNTSGNATYPIFGQPGNWLSVDHVDPRSHDDLVVLCCRCNSRKGNGPPIYDLLGRPGRRVVHLAWRRRPGAEAAPLTLCRRFPGSRIGGWTRVSRTQTQPDGLCRHCWRAARRDA